MSLSAQFKTDTTLETNGVEIQLAENKDGTIATVIIARAGRINPAYQKVADRIFKPHRRAANMGMLSEAKNSELTRKVFAEAGVIGWKNVLMSDVTGVKTDEGYIDYSVENAEKLFVNLPEVYSRLIELATDHQTFMQVVKEEEAKNSAKSLPVVSSKGE